MMPIQTSLIGVAWGGAGRSAADPTMVSFISATVTAVFLFWLLRPCRLVPPRDRGAPATPADQGRVLAFRARRLSRDGAVFVLILMAPAAVVRAQTPAASPSPAPEPSPSPGPAIKIGGFVDAYYAYNGNRPADHANFFSGVGTSAKRDNEVSVNLAEIDLSVDPAPVGFVLRAGFGTGTEVVHAGEPRGIAVGPSVWQHVVQASAQWKTGVGRGLLLEGGVYPSHIGFEAFASKDNWSYTRGWLGELSPYYQTGLKIAYPFSSRWSGQIHVLNGWQMIADNNRGKSLGAQIAYAGERLSVSFNGIAGPELPGDDDDIRVLGDVVATWKATGSLSLGVSADAAHEERPDGDGVGWTGLGVYARLAPPASRAAF